MPVVFASFEKPKQQFDPFYLQFFKPGMLMVGFAAGVQPPAARRVPLAPPVPPRSDGEAVKEAQSTGGAKAVGHGLE